MGKFDGKTEKATPQRRREARSEGTIARSQELVVGASLLSTLLALRAFTGPGIATAARETRTLLQMAPTEHIPAGPLLVSAGKMMGALLTPFLVVAVLSALVAGFAQVGFKLTPKALKPKLSNLSPKKGLEKFKPAQAGWELTRSIVKLGLLAAIVYEPLSTWSAQLAGDRSLDGGLRITLAQVWSILLRAVLLSVVLGAADFAYNKWRVSKQLRMSKQDVKQEYKNQEGDPHVRSARRRRHQELSRNRMLREVGVADVVLVNPTELAIALRYVPGEPAPRVVAKGAGRMAAKIRKLAYRHGVPVQQDKPLCRAMYRRVKVGSFVPAAFYEAVATVLAVAYRRSGRRPGQAARTRRPVRRPVTA